MKRLCIELLNGLSFLNLLLGRHSMRRVSYTPVECPSVRPSVCPLPTTVSPVNAKTAEPIEMPLGC